MKLALVAWFSFLSTYAQTPTYSKQQFLNMSDQQLWELAAQKKVGKCYIFDASVCPTCFCDFYAQTTKYGGYVGLPDAYGSGCLVAPDGQRRINICWGSPNTYPNYSGTSTPICTDSTIKNGANMIRIGLMKGHCDVPDVVEPVVTDCREEKKLLETALLGLKTTGDQLNACNAELVSCKASVKTKDTELLSCRDGKKKAEAELKQCLIEKNKTVPDPVCSAERKKLKVDLGLCRTEKKRSDDANNQCQPEKKKFEDEAKLCKANVGQLNAQLAKAKSDLDRAMSDIQKLKLELEKSKGGGKASDEARLNHENAQLKAEVERLRAELAKPKIELVKRPVPR